MADINELYNQANTGDVDAQFNLAVAYENGDGVTKDINQAIIWYTKVAAQGYASAQYNLGNCYQDDIMPVKDFASSALWYAKAAEQGHLNATYMLAICYKNGEGVPQDIKEAKRLLKAASKQGHEPSDRMLAKIDAAELEIAKEARTIVQNRMGIYSEDNQWTPPQAQAPQAAPPQYQAPQGGAPQYQAPIYAPQKKGMNGCLIAFLVVVGIVVALILFTFIITKLGLD